MKTVPDYSKKTMLNTMQTASVCKFAAAGLKSAISAIAATLVIALSTTGSAFGSALQPAPAAVGNVTLVLGKAFIINAEGDRRPALAGSQIAVSEVIETQGNGHVHVRFIDDALVSVRPSSRLEVIRYEYSADKPAESAVKLNLMEGVTRAISGKAAKAARQNFRMNTPIAAIGVRGTDFVVSANNASVRAQVNEGAIVVAPFSSACTVDAFGPCSLNSLELAGGGSDGSTEILEINATMVQPVLLALPGNDVEDALPANDALVADAAQTEHDEDAGTDIYTDSVTTLAVNRKISGSQNLLEPTPPGPVTVTEFTPTTLVTTEALTAKSQLVWGRWAESRLDNERITVAYSVATDGRDVTVGNNRYALFRTENGSKAVQPGLGIVGFDLKQAQAMLKTAFGSELMNVYGGALNIDFNQNRFATSLQLGHSATGNIEYSDSGRLFAGGYFSSNAENQATAGAVSLDGSEAGYFFEKTLDAGRIEGLTLWGSKP